MEMVLHLKKVERSSFIFQIKLMFYMIKKYVYIAIFLHPIQMCLFGVNGC